ncbi:hypothetical protein SSABA_v1c03600 [Spiroplasma sabaudiense Ar-1343]|uniref:Lipoprotein n=1 Tax=Spiroplasma sabaudiense Ar-1343 TaxID=1276257 RepID=W6AJ77_9MOLU|nr:hypothetical protein [Spiroplasma sabaudiense]AHI53769.1 hypothetical protein SSABA_v1c03600 [Spiroplasma sabaudiense Ar-1343]
MKKILLILSSLSFGITPAATVVSCFRKSIEKEKIQLTVESMNDWIENQNFGYEGGFYFLEDTPPEEQAYLNIFKPLRHKIENVIADEINETFKSNEDDLWEIYVWLSWSENNEIINQNIPFKSKNKYELKFELTIYNNNPNKYLKLEYKNLKFNFKQKEKISTKNVNQNLLHLVVNNADYYENDIKNPFSWSTKSKIIFEKTKDAIKNNEIENAKKMISEYLNYRSNTTEGIPFKEFYFDSTVNDIDLIEKVDETDYIRFKISSNSVFKNLVGIPEIDWEAIYVI